MNRLSDCCSYFRNINFAPLVLVHFASTPTVAGEYDLRGTESMGAGVRGRGTGNLSR